MAITKTLLAKIAKWNDLQSQLAAVKAQEQRCVLKYSRLYLTITNTS